MKLLPELELPLEELDELLLDELPEDDELEEELLLESPPEDEPEELEELDELPDELELDEELEEELEELLLDPPELEEPPLALSLLQAPSSAQAHRVRVRSRGCRRFIVSVLAGVVPGFECSRCTFGKRELQIGNRSALPRSLM